MNKKSNHTLRIRKATEHDARQLCTWWNDGEVMKHAGYPNGIHTTLAEVKAQLIQDQTHHRLIIELDALPIGEMMVYFVSQHLVEFGIKICDLSKQNQGIGKVVLSNLFQSLFHQCDVQKIRCSTELDNHRAQHVYEQLGFQKVERLHDVWRDEQGNWHDGILYEVDQKDFHSYDE